MASVDEVINYIRSNDIRWVDLQFSDIYGTLHRSTISGKEFTEDSFVKGISHIDLAEVFGMAEQGELLLLPDPDTHARIPWESSTVRFICDIITALTKERFVKDVRYISERVETNINAIGLTEARIGADVEFYIFDNVTVDKATPARGPNYLIDAREAYWNPSPIWQPRKGSYLNQPFDSLYAARLQVSEVLADNFHYTVFSHKHGRSQTGQQSVELIDYSLKMAADALVTLKYIVRNLAVIANTSATFMALPMFTERGNSLGIHQSLWKKDSNVFYDAEDEYAQLSQTGRYYIGGILEHLNSLTIFTNPSTNSFKRFFVDPKYRAWSKSNRTAAVQVPYLMKNLQTEKRISYTVSDPSVNPYLAYAAVVAAGLDGIKNKIDPGDPVDENISKLDIKKRKEYNIKILPTNMLEAIESFQSDSKYIKGVFSTEIIADYLDQKLEQFRENEKRPTSYEFEQYFNL